MGSSKKNAYPKSVLIAVPFGIILLAGLIGFGNISSITEQRSWVVSRIEFNPTDQLLSPDGRRFRDGFAPVLYMEKLSASEYLCVPEGTMLYRFLTSHQELTGFRIDSSCKPLDFTHRPGDQLHPELITQPIVRRDLYYAFAPGFEPQSDTAVLVEAHDDVFVMVNVDTLRHVGINVEVDR